MLVQHYFTYLNLLHQNDYYVQFQQPAIFAVTALIGGAFVIQVSFLLEKLNIMRFLRVIGYHSLYIYVMHLMITSAIRNILSKSFGIENIPMLMVVSVTVGVILPVILYNMAERAGAWWLFTLKKPAITREKKRNNKEQPGGSVVVGS
ncbi:OpgC domain-containing protein [Paraflavitalea speifideaquila]|uniref:OpgC domain-containing protein n=1 Tax=Paraflavitalea speifideaquila TaxID=3076558 RepID=UPI0028EE2894|nr:OpgC domain-containing protein [Paraflavitalea speifideiaquila]